MDSFTGTRKIRHRPCCSLVNLLACCFCQTVNERLVLADNKLTILIQTHVENELIINEMAFFLQPPTTPLTLEVAFFGHRKYSARTKDI